MEFLIDMINDVARVDTCHPDGLGEATDLSTEQLNEFLGKKLAEWLKPYHGRSFRVTIEVSLTCGECGDDFEAFTNEQLLCDDCMTH